MTASRLHIRDRIHTFLSRDLDNTRICLDGVAVAVRRWKVIHRMERKPRF